MTQVMIADPTLDPSTRERLGVVESAGTTMRALIDDILDVAKIETGKMTIERAPMDVVATVRDAARIWRDQARGKRLGFDIDLPDAPSWVMGDAARLRQIVFNLLSNAVKFTPAGGISLALALDAGHLRLRSPTRASAFVPRRMSSIFEKLPTGRCGVPRASSAARGSASRSAGIARGMGGDVSVVSQLGEGATFMLDVLAGSRTRSTWPSSGAGC
ncbi:sensor histidine kinase [Sphingomonas sp. MMS24-JH45]